MPALLPVAAIVAVTAMIFSKRYLDVEETARIVGQCGHPVTAMLAVYHIVAGYHLAIVVAGLAALHLTRPRKAFLPYFRMRLNCNNMLLGRYARFA